MKPVSLCSLSTTQELAQLTAQLLGPGVSIGLIGPLGAGKTAFTRFLVDALKGDSRQVGSPSFTLEYEYLLPDGVVIEHWDLYRVTLLPSELLEPVGPRVMRIIEWPDRCPEILRELDLVLRFALDDAANRTVTGEGKFASALFDGQML